MSAYDITLTIATVAFLSSVGFFLSVFVIGAFRCIRDIIRGEFV